MMVTAVDSVELTRDLSKVLARVRAGDRFVITEAGQAVAELIPPTKDAKSDAPAPISNQEAVRRAIAELKAARDNRPPAAWVEIREWVHEGRR